MAQKWAKYKTTSARSSWTKARGVGRLYAHWDDHEFINDFSRFENIPARVGDVTSTATLFKRGLKAFDDYNPTTYSSKTASTGPVRWGKNLELFFLDERSFRSASADYGGACDNPPGSGNPTSRRPRRRSTRNVFAAIVPSLANPVPPAAWRDQRPEPDDARPGQLQQFKQDVSSSTRDVQGDHQRGPDPAVLRAALRPLGGLRGRAAGAAALLADNVKNASS